jgi:viroplasmin and RNaseH domain-containing protein
MTKYISLSIGDQRGIFILWNDCKEQVIGYKNVGYKKFDTKEERENYIQLFVVYP